MIETIKSIILDFQETRLETGVPWRLRIETVNGKAAVCIGVHQSGKSTYMFQVIQRLLESGVPRQNILYLNFFDDRLHNLRQDNLGLIAEVYYSIYPEKKNTELVYCFFGESTQMCGRALSREMFPFSFRKFLDYKEIESEDAYFLFTVRIFDPFLACSKGNPKKVYCIDHALVTSVSSEILVNSCHLLDNLVFTVIRRLHPEIYYYKNKTGREVDFIVPMCGQSKMLVQVFDSLAEPQTRKRETAALRGAMAELDLEAGTIKSGASMEFPARTAGIYGIAA